MLFAIVILDHDAVFTPPALPDLAQAGGHMPIPLSIAGAVLDGPDFKLRHYQHSLTWMGHQIDLPSECLRVHKALHNPMAAKSRHRRRPR